MRAGFLKIREPGSLQRVGDRLPSPLRHDVVRAALPRVERDPVGQVMGDEYPSGPPRAPRQQPVALLELFFDLAFVFAFTQLSRKLVSDLTWTGAYQTLVLLLAVLWAWTMTAWLTNRLDPRRTMVQVLVLGIMIGSLAMAAVLADAFEKRGVVFAGVTVVLHVAVPLFIILDLPEPERRTGWRLLGWCTGTAALWLAGGIAGGAAGEVLWTLAAAVDFAAYALRYPTPRLGPIAGSEWPVAADHLAERHRQLFIIALGELILVTGLTFTRTDFTADQTSAFAVSILTTTLFWRIYVYQAGELLDDAIRAASDPVRLARPIALAHLAMIVGVVVTAVGDELVITQPFGRSHPAWVAVLLGGPALFVAGRLRLEQTVFGRVSPHRPVALLTLLVASAPLLFAPPLVTAVAVAAVLAAVVLIDARNAQRRPTESAAPRDTRA